MHPDGNPLPPPCFLLSSPIFTMLLCRRRLVPSPGCYKNREAASANEILQKGVFPAWNRKNRNGARIWEDLLKTCWRRREGRPEPHRGQKTAESRGKQANGSANGSAFQQWERSQSL